ncbi:MAG: hypothetical protein EOP53_08100, partial [Sphingobacteriales bacterium]
MIRLLFLNICLLAGIALSAKNIEVKNIDELHKANKAAAPGDIIILQNGEWNNVTIELDCKGTAMQPILFKADTAGKVRITGHSRLLIGGAYIVVDGFYFTNGFSGKTPVIQFRDANKEPAYNCRVTNSVIDGYNNPKRLEDNNWVLFYGKHNRMDHCTIQDKQNMGVTVAVILDDEKSRENFHSIDHNYFGKRIPLGSNGGETIRVGLSQHALFNSNTMITDNFFEHCDGETEIISIKSCSNIIRNNLFKESFGSVVLRHGDNNVVESNVFLGNGKDGTGGVRVINKGQWVVGNLFYGLRGAGFRSPLAVMNGVPNSPAIRYVSAQDAVIANNTWYKCEPLAFCEGSNTERSETPHNIWFINNIIAGSDLAYKTFDNTDGFHFAGNQLSHTQQQLAAGFEFTQLKNVSIGKLNFPVATRAAPVPDSIRLLAGKKLLMDISTNAGFYDTKKLESVIKNAYDSCGAKWLIAAIKTNNKLTYTCKDAAQLAAQLAETRADITIIRLTGTDYEFTEPLQVNKNITITASSKKIRFTSKTKLAAVFEVNAGSYFTLQGLNADLAGLQAENFILTEKDGNTAHVNINLTKNSIAGFTGNILKASKSSYADSVVISQNNFNNTKGTLFSFNNENDKKSFYNVEKLYINNNTFNNHEGQILAMLREGGDESTMGPRVWFNKNVLN